MSTFSKRATKLEVKKQIEVPIKKGKNPDFKVKRVGILGYGEIGKAIHQLYKDANKNRATSDRFLVKISDLALKKNEFEKFKRVGKKGLDILHVCIPFSNKFEDIILENIERYAKDALVIINSTVAVGTTKSLAESHKFIVHSYVTGVHPNLVEGLKTFIKYVGSSDSGAARIATEHFEDLSLKTKAIYRSENTEAMKLWDTTAYGISIMLQKEIHRYCEEKGLNFDEVYTEATNNYNMGYATLERYDVLRPILRHIDGKIGGHCVIPNAAILAKDSWLAKLLIEKNDEY